MGHGRTGRVGAVREARSVARVRTARDNVVPPVGRIVRRADVLARVVCRPLAANDVRRKGRGFAARHALQILHSITARECPMIHHALRRRGAVAAVTVVALHVASVAAVREVAGAVAVREREAGTVEVGAQGVRLLIAACARGGVEAAVPVRSHTAVRMSKSIATTAALDARGSSRVGRRIGVQAAVLFALAVLPAVACDAHTIIYATSVIIGVAAYLITVHAAPEPLAAVQVAVGAADTTDAVWAASTLIRVL